MRVTRLADYWKDANGYCRSYIMITRRKSIEEIRECGKEIVLFGWFPQAAPLIGVLKEHGIGVKYVCEVGQIPQINDNDNISGGVILKDYRELIRNCEKYFFIFFSWDDSVDIWTSPLVKRVRLLQYKGVDEYGVVSDVRTRDLDRKGILLRAVYDSINEIFYKASLLDWGTYWLCRTQAGIDIQNWDYLLCKAYEMYKDKPCQSLMEIGPGVGVLSLSLKKLIDINITWLMVPDEEAQWAAWRKESSLRLYEKYDIKIKEAYVETEDFDGMYDIIILSQVMEHFIFNPVATMKKLARHLNENGTMFVAVPDIIYNDPPNVESYKEIPFVEDLKTREIQRRTVINSYTHFHEYSFEEALDVFRDSGLECIASHSNLPIHHFVLKKKI